MLVHHKLLCVCIHLEFSMCFLRKPASPQSYGDVPLMYWRVIVKYAWQLMGELFFDRLKTAAKVEGSKHNVLFWNHANFKNSPSLYANHKSELLDRGQRYVSRGTSRLCIFTIRSFVLCTCSTNVWGHLFSSLGHCTFVFTYFFLVHLLSWNVVYFLFFTRWT